MIGRHSRSEPGSVDFKRRLAFHVIAVGSFLHEQGTTAVTESNISAGDWNLAHN